MHCWPLAHNTRRHAIRSHLLLLQWRREKSTKTTSSSCWETLATNPELRRLRRRKREELDEENLLKSSVLLQHEWVRPMPLAGNTIDNHNKRDDRREIVTSFVKEQAKAMMTGACNGTLGFQLEIRPSGIADGGDGLFLVAAAGTSSANNNSKQQGVVVKRGQAVTLYGGRVFLKEEIDHFGTSVLVSMMQEGQRSHVLGKAGGDCVDGFTHAGLSVTEKEVAASPAVLCALKERRQQQQSCRRSPTSSTNQRFPFALGHMSNHCPDGRPPNLVGWGVNYDMDFYEIELRRGQFAAPNTFALELAISGEVGSQNRTPLPCPSSIVMLATRDIQAGEELFQDYGFEHSPPTPPWFHPAGLLHDLDNPPGDDNKMNARTVEEGSRGAEADAAKGALVEWKAVFVETHGRSPSREDMDGDPIAKSLFEVFRRK